ncbi:hypothetical protein GGS23DRAFT_556188 [Durotheca rogersii]|uniref:uncharacterized protein n=1 Tax=Durotheca rogersii TaxID=419775 RepID=UPI00221F5E44|nr:uncharacterized protein GGS23DRAFT_556188 [Durotheca rogersii]KAI5866251.1 hypothetical protein GGS23DRAFT_556188 [Durotheca rogersii]
MRRFFPVRSCAFGSLRSQRPKCFSAVAGNAGQVLQAKVRCGLSGEITVDLHNPAKILTPDPLMIYLPPYSIASSKQPAELPKFIRGQPTVVINYRWAGFVRSSARDFPRWEKAQPNQDRNLRWPTPIHDTTIAYNWILENLTAGDQPREIYVCGSYLGATLAASLALTETYPEERMSIRGCVAYNGIYNWTSFFPGHPLNFRSHPGPEDEEWKTDSSFDELGRQAKKLFGIPGDLFDPFASPYYFFHRPKFAVPKSFTGELAELEERPQQKRGSTKLASWKQVNFPPPEAEQESSRRSRLRIPEMLLMHSAPPPSERLIREYWPGDRGNCFMTQAEDLGMSVKRGAYHNENKEHASSLFDGDTERDEWMEGLHKRVSIRDVGGHGKNLSLSPKAEFLARDWIQDRMPA